MTFKKTTVYGLIPAKKNSERLKNKNLLKVFKNETLLSVAIKEAFKSDNIDKIYVSSDSKKVLNYSSKLGSNILMRGKLASSSLATSSPVILDFIKQLKLYKSLNSYIIYMQPTSLMRNHKHINEAFRILKKSKKKNCISFKIGNRTVIKSFIKKRNKLTPLYSENVFTENSENLPTILVPNGAIYIFTVGNFLNRKRIPTKNISSYIMSEKESIDIDTREQFLKAKKIYNI